MKIKTNELIGAALDWAVMKCEQAKAKHPNLGITPTAVSMAWPLHPQPKEIMI